jgi:tetratricopeptide (TPR) repeat protein
MQGRCASHGYVIVGLGAVLLTNTASAQIPKAIGSSGVVMEKTGGTGEHDSSDSKPGRASVVSIDFLRHPISNKVKQELMKAIAEMNLRNYQAAIDELSKTLTRHPESAPYVKNLLGVAYVKTDRFDAAVQSLEQAASLLPGDAMTHYNFGLALICDGDSRRAAQEFRRAFDLDPGIPGIQAKLNALKAYE